MWLGESGHHRERVVISLGDPLPLMVKNCKPSVLFSNEMLFYMRRSAMFLYEFVQYKRSVVKSAIIKHGGAIKYYEFLFKLIDCVV
jgi:hypothetical protein